MSDKEVTSWWLRATTATVPVFSPAIIFYYIHQQLVGKKKGNDLVLSKADNTPPLPSFSAARDTNTPTRIRVREWTTALPMSYMHGVAQENAVRSFFSTPVVFLFALRRFSFGSCFPRRRERNNGRLCKYRHLPWPYANVERRRESSPSSVFYSRIVKKALLPIWFLNIIIFLYRFLFFEGVLLFKETSWIDWTKQGREEVIAHRFVMKETCWPTSKEYLYDADDDALTLTFI